MFHWSVVGAVSSIVTRSPAAALVPTVPCTQQVSPSVESIHWSMSDCPVPGVRAMALSQSCPTAKESEPAAWVVIVTLGAPVDPEADAAVPVPAAPESASTVSCWA